MLVFTNTIIITNIYILVFYFIIDRFLTPSEALRVSTERSVFFFFRVPILMASNGCGLDRVQCALLCKCNVELFILVPFPTPNQIKSLLYEYRIHIQYNNFT